MFTGLVEGQGAVLQVQDLPVGRQIEVDLGALASEVGQGDSISVSGVCLTVVRLAASRARFDVSRETLDRSHLGTWIPGRRVNLERSLRVGDRLGGHFVTGHVDAVGRMLGRQAEGDFEIFEIALPAALRPLVVEKGSIAVDGVSLTVAALAPESFRVALIPETLRRTTLGTAAPGSPLHLEADLLAKHVQRLLDARGTPPGAPAAPSASA